MGSVFSSPSKQAQQSSSAVQGINSQDIAQAEQYVSQQQAALRTALGQQTNPYFEASAKMNPSGYGVNPHDTVTFGSNGITEPHNQAYPKPPRQTPHPNLPPPGVLGNNPPPAPAKGVG